MKHIYTKIIIPILLFSLISIELFSQDLKGEDTYKNENFFGIVKASLALPISVEYENDHATEKIGSLKSSILSLNAIGGYYLIPELSLGLGFGLDGFHNPTANTFPIYGDLRYYVKDEGDTWYGLLNYGKNLKLNDSFKKGELIRIGVGYKFFIGKVCWVADMHYGQYDISLDNKSIRESQKTYSFRQTLGFSIGIMF